MAENLTNGAQTTLNGAINNSQTTATLTSASGWPAAPFRALISAEGGNTDEIIYVGAISSTSLTSITRAAEPIADGTQVAQAHGSGAIITQVLTRVGLINQGLSAGTIGAVVYPGSNTSAGTGSYARLDIFNTESFDTDGFHSTSSNNGRFTVPAGLAGKYLVYLHTYNLGANGQFTAIYRNGVVQGYSGPMTSADTMTDITLVFDAVAGDYFEAYYGGSSVTWVAAGTWFGIVKLDSGNVGIGVGAKAYNSTTQSVSTGADRVVTFDSEDWDTDGFHSTSSNTGRMTVPIGLSGYYLISAHLWGITTACDVSFRINGTNNRTSVRWTATAGEGFTLTTALSLTAGDYVEVIINPDSGTFSIGHASVRSAQCEFLIMRLDSGSPNIKATANFAIPPLDRTTVTGMDTTYGDDFTDSALNARWTRQTQGSGEESYQQGPRQSALQVAYSTGAASRYIYQALATTTWTFETSLSVYEPTSTGQMFGIMALDSSQNGVGVLLYDNGQGLYLANIVSGSFSSTLSTIAYSVSDHRVGQRYWLRLRAAAGTFFASYSFDGEAYSPELSGTPSAFTIARIGIGRFLGTQSGDTAYWHWFDKTA